MNTLSYGIYVLSSATVILSFLAFLIFSRNNFNLSIIHKGISLLLFVLSFRFITIHLYLNQMMEEFPHFLLVNHLTSKIGLPVFYIVVFLSLHPRKLKALDLLHFALPVLFVINFAPVYFGKAEYKIELIQGMSLNGYDYIWDKGLFLSPVLAQWFGYFMLYGYTLAVGYLLIHPSEIKKLPKSVVNFFKITFLFLIANLLPSLVAYLNIGGMEPWIFSTLVGLVSTLFVVFGMFLIPDFLFVRISRKEVDQFQFDYEKLQSEIFVEIKPNELYQRVVKFFEEEKPYLNPDFSLSTLERKFGISGRYISEAIKVGSNLNFSQFVNQYRISYLFEHLAFRKDFASKTIEEIALEIGFKSVTSFYSYFRKVKGCTPKEYFEKIEIRNDLVLAS